MGGSTTPAFCLKAVGIELAHMAASRPKLLWLDLYLHGHCTHHLPLTRHHLAAAPRLNPDQRALLARDQRRPGEHRPKRLTLGPWDHFPYVFHRALLPAPGLVLRTTVPQDLDHLWTPLHLVFWLHLYDPMPWPPIVYLLGSDARQHPVINQVRWVCHRRWTLAHTVAPLVQVVEERDHGRMVKVTVGWQEGA